MTKRYFIRRSHSDLVQEQNKLLETLLAKQDRREPIFIQAPQPKEDYVSDLKQDPKQAEAPDIEFYFDLPEMPYIPTSHKSNVTLQSVETSKASFDEKSVEKLKKTRFNAKLD